MLIDSTELESEERLAAVRTYNDSESLREPRLVADVEKLIVARENKSDSFRKAILAADVERVIVAHEYKN